MRCDEFEAALQQLADGRPSQYDEAALNEHARKCAACRELEEGFRMLAQAFAASRMPSHSPDLADRIVAAAAAPKRFRAAWPVRLPWLAAAATILIAVGSVAAVISLGSRLFVAEQLGTGLAGTKGSITELAQGEALFPGLLGADGTDPREPLLRAQAVEPVSEIVRAVGRSVTNPIRPLATATTEAVNELFGELPQPELPDIPGMEEMMSPQMRSDMQQKQPSS